MLVNPFDHIGCCVHDVHHGVHRVWWLPGSRIMRWWTYLLAVLAHVREVRCDSPGALMLGGRTVRPLRFFCSRIGSGGIASPGVRGMFSRSVPVGLPPLLAPSVKMFLGPPLVVRGGTRVLVTSSPLPPIARSAVWLPACWSDLAWRSLEGSRALDRRGASARSVVAGPLPSPDAMASSLFGRWSRCFKHSFGAHELTKQFFLALVISHLSRCPGTTLGLPEQGSLDFFLLLLHHSVVASLICAVLVRGTHCFVVHAGAFLACACIIRDGDATVFCDEVRQRAGTRCPGHGVCLAVVVWVLHPESGAWEEFGIRVRSARAWAAPRKVVVFVLQLYYRYP